MIDQKIKNEKDCTGCHGCSAICPKNCISMVSNHEGFWYPKVDYNKCIKCTKCTDVCPIIYRTSVKNEPIAFACMNRDEDVRLNSSSGGIFSLVAEHIIENSGVVFGVKFDNDFNVIHSYTEDIENISNFRGSKYVQSRIGDTYRQAKEFLEQGRQVLFTGTPCQIAGLKSYLGKCYKNLFTIDIICHGVPSPKVWRKYIEFHQSEVSLPIQQIEFRNKMEGWKLYSISILFLNEIEYCRNHRKDLYMKAFLKDICLRPSCYDCKFKTLNRESDITLADFWGVRYIMEEMDDDKGTSLVFVNSENGKTLMNEIKDKIIYKPVALEDSIEYNPAAIRSASVHPNRNNFFENLDKLNFDKLVNKYCNDKFQVKIKKRFVALIVYILRKTGTFDLAKSILKKD